MKILNRMLPLLLAGLLQTLPLLRTVFTAIQNEATPTWAYVFPWVAGGVAFLGYDAVSSASGISISPPTATVGVFYSGTVTYSGGHAGSVSSMALSNSVYGGAEGECLSSGSLTLVAGLTISYSGGNTASISGTPTGSASTNLFRLIQFDDSGCSTGSFHDNAESTKLIVLPVGGAQYAPSFASVPQNDVAQVGSTVILSGGAVGNPTPSYFWKLNAVNIPGATNNSLTIPNVQLTNSGAYTLYASNSVGVTPAICVLSVCQTPGSNILALAYTNYLPAGTAVTMYTFLTNVTTAVTSYSWDFNLVSIGVTTPNLSIAASLVTPAKSGEYSVFFSSTNSGTAIVSSQEYDSYWTFGYVPGLNSSPVSVSTNVGANVTLTATVTGTAPNVFWYQNATNLVAVQTPTFNPSSSTLNAAGTNLSLTLSNLVAANAGTYTVVITNFWGSITSAPAVLTVTSPLAVSAPSGETNYVGNSISLNATATGAGTLAYQWRKGTTSLANGGTVSGATTTNLTIVPAALTDSGSYSLVVTNSSSSITSSVAVVSIVPVPKVTSASSGINLSLIASGGIPYRNYIVETSTNLDTGIWLPLLTNQASPSGAISFTGTNTPGVNQTFYQLKFP